MYGKGGEKLDFRCGFSSYTASKCEKALLILFSANRGEKSYSIDYTLMSFSSFKWYYEVPKAIIMLAEIPTFPLRFPRSFPSEDGLIVAGRC